ncbi:MAG TPA: hypothetical protein VL025_04450 [Thermoanaerobaculia bacterium]|nr:hypothetical protein [Thermoanaerobaculia bacterium]
MIRIDRNAVPVPHDLHGDGSIGGRERRRTLEHFADPSRLQEPYDEYSAYKSKSVVQALEELFHGKCAYCESRYRHLHPVDVEHFRPKGGVAVLDRKTGKMRLQRPGYYWLAASWENLLPSCIDCNRERTQEFADEAPGKSGKANQFPLSGKPSRLAPGCEAREKRLLLHPCEDDPAEHLEFIEEGVVRPDLGNRRRPSRQGEVSIAVYGLQRINLVQRRRDLAKKIEAQIQRVRRAAERKIRYPEDPSFGEDLRAEMAELRSYLEDGQEYAGMARQIVLRLLGSVPF